MFGVEYEEPKKKKMKQTAQSDYAELKSVLLKHPREAFRSRDYLAAHWQELHYLAMPDYDKAVQEYEAFVEIFVSHNIEVNFLPATPDTGLDSIYVRDASIPTDQGVLVCNMGKRQRQAEPAAQLSFYLQNNWQVLGSFQPPATIEGGDVAWLRPDILAVGHGYRTNKAGIDMLRELTTPTVKEVVVMEAPHYKGPDDVFHLMSVLSPVDHNLAVVYSPLMTVPFRNYLLDLGFELVEVPDEEFDTLGSNVLAIAPRVCIMVAGNPVTKSRLQAAGAEVIEFSGEEICLKGNGGPTCLTRPLMRQL